VGTFYTGVKNSVYTNSIAALTADYACEMAGGSADCSSTWTDLSSKLKILVENKDTDQEWHPEYENFPKMNPFWNGGGKVKQADVTMLHFPMNRMLSKASMRNDLEKYEPLYDAEGPAMTLSVSVVLWLRLGNLDRANALLLNSTRNIQTPFNIWTESATKNQHQTLKDEGCFNFLTGAGGFLQSIAFGYGGLKYGRDECEMRPTLPLNSTSMKFRSIEFQGGRYSFEMLSDKSCELCIVQGSHYKIAWNDSDSFTSLEQGECSRSDSCLRMRLRRIES
jgi:protein-glucosylgalactosylhydroxylysine glucosidase